MDSYEARLQKCEQALAAAMRRILALEERVRRSEQNKVELRSVNG